MTKLQDVIGDYDHFLEQIIAEVQAAGFDMADFVQLDHLCYRVSTLEAYEQKKQAVLAFATLMAEAQVNGRPIATFRLNEPIWSGKWRIDALEIPAPKEGVPTNDGLEHIEFVVFDDLHDFANKYADKSFELRAADRGINPEISFTLPSSCVVKFHRLNLPIAVYLQNKLGIQEIKDNQ